MKDDLAQALFASHPNILASQGRLIGIACGDGWYTLIDELCRQLQSQTTLHAAPQVVAQQVKGKFGGLRFYVGAASATQHALIEFAEALSYRTCDMCGAVGDLGHDRRDVYSVKCSRHRPFGFVTNEEEREAAQRTDAARARCLLIDLEATCDDKGSIPRGEMEIIEIGAVMVDTTTWSVLDQFTTFVRPGRHPTLTPFCTALTTITQADVDAAPDYPAALTLFSEWLCRYGDFIWGSWGEYDRKQIRQDCDLHRVSFPIDAEYINFKKRFSKTHGLKKRPSLRQALELAQLDFLGTPHRGVDDARNIAQLLPYILDGKSLPGAAAISP